MDAAIKDIRTHLPSLMVSGLLVYFAVAFALGGANGLLLLHQGASDYNAVALARMTGHAFEPTLDKVVLVAAAIGATKLAIGALFIVAVIERPPAGMAVGSWQDYDALDVALYSAIALTLLLMLPAWTVGDFAAVRMHMAHAALICVAIAASVIEREHAERVMTRVGHLDGRAGNYPQPDEVLSFGR
jgi:hypothetical protein